MLELLRPPPHRGPLIAAGAVVLATGLALLELRLDDKLAVGVHLQGVGETQACGFAKAGHDGGAFARVGGQGQQ